MEYKTFDKPQKVTALFGHTQKLHFHGRLEDMPLPVIDKNDTTFLANMALLGIWNDSFTTSTKSQGEPVLIKSIEFEGPTSKGGRRKVTQIFSLNLRIQQIKKSTLVRFLNDSYPKHSVGKQKLMKLTAS